MPGIFGPGAQHEATNAVTYVFKDSGEPLQLLAIFILAIMALISWSKYNNLLEKEDNEQDIS